MQVALGSQINFGSCTSLGLINQLSRNNALSVVEFAASRYAVLECDGKCTVRIIRRGNLQHKIDLRFVHCTLI